MTNIVLYAVTTVVSTNEYYQASKCMHCDKVTRKVYHREQVTVSTATVGYYHEGWWVKTNLYTTTSKEIK